jgi:chloramphenicol 3-O phosphotransferase
VLRGMRQAMAALARQGNNLIVDDVMLDNDAAEYAEAFAGLRVHWVGVFAPLEVLEERERARGDRDLGLSRWLSRHMHKGIAYDLELDTSQASPAECAERIKQAFGL